MEGTYKKYGISGAVFKNIAYLSMFIDHFFAVFYKKYLNLMTIDGQGNYGLTVIYRTGRAVGRIAFVLFAHQIVEGFFHTRSKGKFLLRLGIFALVSEIPFDLAFCGKVIDFGSQNIFFTLFLGVLVLTLWERLSLYNSALMWFCRCGVVLLACLLAYWGSTDYRYMGVLLILVFYCAHDEALPWKMLLAGSVMFWGIWSANCLRYLELGYTAWELLDVALRELYGLAAFIPIAFYNGQKGRQFPKAFYYGFYPLHLLGLYVAAETMEAMWR